MEEIDLVLHRNCTDALTVCVKLDRKNSNDDRVADVKYSRNYSSCRTSIRLCVVATALIVILSMCSGTDAMPRALMCQMECLNGGKMHVPDLPFAYCMCICPRQFEGIRCEFNRLRTYSPRRIRKVNRLKRLVKIRNEVRDLLSEKKRRRHRHYKR